MYLDSLFLSRFSLDSPVSLARAIGSHRLFFLALVYTVGLPSVLNEIEAAEKHRLMMLSTAVSDVTKHLSHNVTPEFARTESAMSSMDAAAASSRALGAAARAVARLHDGGHSAGTLVAACRAPTATQRSHEGQDMGLLQGCTRDSEHSEGYSMVLHSRTIRRQAPVPYP